MMLINLNELQHLLNPKKYAGEKETSKAFSWQFYWAVRALGLELLARLQWVEKHLDADYSEASLDP